MARSETINNSKSPKPATDKLLAIFRLHTDALNGDPAAATARNKALGKLTMNEAAVGIALSRGFSRLFAA